MYEGARFTLTFDRYAVQIQFVRQKPNLVFGLSGSKSTKTLQITLTRNS